MAILSLDQALGLSFAGRHPYLPFQLYLIGGAGTLSEVTGMPFVLSVKLAPILADAALAVLIFQSSSLPHLECG